MEKSSYPGFRSHRPGDQYSRQIAGQFARVGLEPGGNAGGGIAVEGSIEILGDVADVWGRENVVQLPEGMVGRQWLGFEHIDRGPGDPARLQRFDQGHLIDDRTARCVDESRRRLHHGEFGRSDQPFGTIAEDEMDGHDIGFAEQRLLVDEMRAGRGGLLFGEVLAPRDHLHAESLADPCHRPADIAETQHPKRAPSEVVADKALPAARA
jgi:hypothetical protein